MDSEEAHTRWHQERLDTLRAAEGWLTVIDLVWLDDGIHCVGTEEENAIRLPKSSLRGQLEIAGTTAIWHPTNGAVQTLHTDRNTHGGATVIRDGTISFFLIEREEGLALRIRDTEAPTRTHFHGIESFAFDPRWQIDAEWTGDCAQFEIAGKQHTLRAQSAADDPLHFVFADTTSGHSTYGGGRFLYADAPAGHRIRLDFNRSINPPCAFTPFAVCPLPPAENRLAVAIDAGEKIYR